MRIREIKNSRVAKFFNVQAITLYPFIFYSDPEPTDDLRYHELTHVLQIQVEGFFTFYIRYVVQYYWGLLCGKDSYDAYLSIDYEVVAYQQQGNFLCATFQRHLLTERLKAVGMIDQNQEV